MSERAVSSRRVRIACALLLLAFVAVFFWPILGGGRIPIYRDILHTTFPLGRYIGERLRSFELPQWFPFEGLGEPFIGQLNESAFHPASWLYAVLPPIAALRWELLLGYAAAALGQLFYARRLGASDEGALLSAVVFAFSGYALSLSNLVPYLWGMAALPWVGLCAAGVARAEAPWPWVAGLAVSWASVVVAGDSHSALFAGVVVLFTFGVLGGARRLPLAFAAGAVALGISSAELLPALGVVAGGPRGRWSRISTLSATWALHPYRLPELLFAGWIPEHIGGWIGADRYREPLRWAISVYLGLPAAALGLLGLASRTRRGVAAALLALSALWLALGVHGGLEPLLRRALPFLNVLRYPEKHLALWTFGASLAAGAGLDRLRRRPSPRFCLGLLAAAALLLAARFALPADLPARLWKPLASRPGWTSELSAAWRAGLLSAALWLAALAAALLLARRRPLALWLVPAVLFLELWTAGGSAVAVASPRVLTEQPRFCAAAVRAGAGPAGVRALDGATRAAPYSDAASAAHWATLERNLLDPSESSLCGVPSATSSPTLSNEPRALRDMLGTEGLADNPAPALFGFGLVVLSERPKRPAPGEVIVDVLSASDAAYALAARPAAPRAYAAQPRWGSDEAAAQAELSRGLALVDSPLLLGEPPPGTALASAPAPTGEVRIAAYAPERVVLEARMERAGAVVLNDLFAPGWTATVDGVPSRIYAANVLARGVLVPRGDHRIEMRYRLPRLRAGLLVSGASLALCLGLALFARRRRAPELDAAQAEHALQRAYWAEADRAHCRWQTENAYIASTEIALLDRVAAAAGERLLEIGCGEGANLRNLRPRLGGVALFGVDFSRPKVACAVEAPARGACADATALPFRDGAFDAVLIRDLLHHVPDRAGVLREAARVLRPGGRLTLIEPNGKNPLMAAMALGIRAERGMLASTAARAEAELRDAGLVGIRLEPRQPLPLSRAVLHHQLGLPSLARFAAVRAALRALERAAAVLPRSRWSYLVLQAARDR